MSRAGTSTLNYFLTSYAQGLANDLLQIQQVVNAICPTVTVSGASGQFKSFSDRNAFTTYNTQRGLGGKARRISFEATDSKFNAAPQALEVTVDDFERQLANAAGNPLADQLLDQGKVKALTNSAALSHVAKVVAFVIANTTAVANRGNWSAQDVDPIDQLDEQLEGLVTDVGSSENINLTLSIGAWRTLRNHPLTKKRCTGVQVFGITREQLMSALMIPVNVVIGSLSQVSNAEGQAAVSKKNVIGAHALLTYAVPSPSIYDPSAFKCFTTGQGNIEAVRTYRAEDNRSDVHAVDWSEDLQVTSALSARRLAIA